MKYILLATSIFIFGSVSAQAGNTLPTAVQNDSAISVGRGLITGKLADLKAAHTSNNAALFQTYAQEYLGLMRTGMIQRGRKIDLDPKADLKAGLANFEKIEFTVYDFRKMINAAQPDRAEIIKKAEYFKTVY